MKALLVSFVFQLFFILSVFGGESRYIELTIKESKKDDKTEFSIKEVKAFFGDYENLCCKLEDRWINSTRDYTIEVYDKDKEVIGRYVVASGRFIFWDGKNTGGMIELNFAESEAVVPYKKTKPPAFLKVKYKDKKTDLLPIPLVLEKLEKEFKELEEKAKKKKAEMEEERKHLFPPKRE